METIAISNVSRAKINGHCHQIRKQGSTITCATHRSSLLTSYSNNYRNSFRCSFLSSMSNDYDEDRLPDLHVIRRTDNECYTAPTMFSVVSRSDRSSSRSQFRRDAATISSSRSSLFRFLKQGRRRKQLSEAQLRKQVRKHCDRGDWSRVRKLVSNHDFTEIPDVLLDGNSVVAKSASSESKQSSNNELVHAPTSRRPSYGSRTGERLSFTGKESAAASAAIKAAAVATMLEESSSSEECIGRAENGCGENILHDVCRHHPPRDVIEMLLVAMRHRRGSTCGRDEKGRTPLHVAVASGASSGVIDALTRADPVPATMGDDDKRSPLHLAVKFLAYEERYLQQNQLLPRPQPSSKYLFSKSNSRGSVKTNFPVLSREEAIEDTKQIVHILKNAMMTYPGEIDFKDEDNNGFAPLDYAIDGSIDDRTILRSLIRRNISEDYSPQSTIQSQASERNPKTKNSFAAKLTKQTSLTSIRSIRQKRRSTLSGSSASSHDSGLSQDIELDHHMEEEINARKHRINRINARNQKERMQDRLFDVFGIEVETNTLEDLSMTLNDQPYTVQVSCLPQERLKESSVSNDMHLNSSSAPFKVTIDEPMTTLIQEKAPEVPAQCNFGVGPTPIIKEMKTMSEEEIYNLHLQAYLDDLREEFMGDLEYCDDLDFFYNDPEEVDPRDQEFKYTNEVIQEKDSQVLIFEICIKECSRERSLDFDDDCSEVTCV